MRYAAPLFAVLALVPGCARRSVAQRAANPAAVEPRAANWARLAAPSEDGVVRFTLARPAYVAVFAVVPGESVRLVSPITRAEGARPLRAGEHIRSARRGIVTPPRLVSFRTGYSPQSRYLYLIASDRPLDLRQPLRWPGGALTVARETADVRIDPRSREVEGIFEQLFDLVARDSAGAEVATDVVEYYPDVRFRRGGQVASLTAFRCADGQLVYIPSAYDPRGYAADGWYGVDFIGNQYVGAECFRSYYGGGRGGGQLVGVGVAPRRPSGAARVSPDTLRPRDVRPNAPVEPERLRPAGGVPGSGQGTAPLSGFERIERIERRPAPPPAIRHEPRSIEREPRVEAPEPSPAPRTEPRLEPAARPEPRPEPRAEPRAEPRSEPMRLEPARSEPMSDPGRGAPSARSDEPVREPLQAALQRAP